MHLCTQMYPEKYFYNVKALIQQYEKLMKNRHSTLSKETQLQHHLMYSLPPFIFLYIIM